MSIAQMAQVHVLAYTQECLSQVIYLDCFRDALRFKDRDDDKKGHWEKRRTMSHKSFKLRRISRINSRCSEDLSNNVTKRRKLDLNGDDTSTYDWTIKRFLRYENFKRCREFRRRIYYLIGYLHNMHRIHPNYDESDQFVRWLDNHLWFRKRMKMEIKWGFCLPTCHFSRGYKSLRNALKNGCTMHDMSYIRPIEISSKILIDLVSIINNFVGIDIQTLQQFKEIQVSIYTNQSDSGRIFLGYANLMFLSFDSNSLFKVWLWCHPSIYFTTFQELKLKSVHFSSVLVSELTVGINRYRVCGMKATQLIRNVLQPILYNKGSGENINSNEDIFAALMNSESLDAVWDTDMGLSLNIKDDRLDIGKWNGENLTTTTNRKIICEYWENNYGILGQSLLFNEVERKIASSKFRPDHICNEYKYLLKKKLNIPKHTITSNRVTTVEDLKISPIPILIIRKHSDKMKFRGYDIILPSKWGPYLWNKLHMAGGRAIGIDENDYIQLSSTKLSFPRDFPETLSGEKYWNAPNDYYFKDCIVLRDKNILVDFYPFITNKMKKTFLQSDKLENRIEGMYNTLRIKHKRFLVTVALTPTSRGRPLDGARLYLPNEQDYKYWMFHTINNKVAMDMYREKRIGNWKGHEIKYGKKKSIHDYYSIQNLTEESLSCNYKLLGLVTSGYKSTTPIDNCAIGLCDAYLLHEKFSTGLQVNNGKMDAVCALVLFNNLNSSWLRPALLKIM